MSEPTKTEAPSASGEEPSALGRLLILAREAGAREAADDARALSERVAQGRFYVACVGQFKRGKSTLLNALIGEPVLPVGVAPVTSAVTILAYAAQQHARVRLSNGVTEAIALTDVTRYVSEQENPENVRGVVAVEVFVPSPLLATGLCLVDTPGLGSVFAGNTAVTRAFVPHIDAALVVIGADPPLSGEELALIQEISREVPEILFALNKADRLTEAERSEGRAFAERVLIGRGGLKQPAIFSVSALEVITQQHPTRDWESFCEHLNRLASESGAGLVQAAERRGIERLTHAILRTLEERAGALTRPLAESEERARALQRALAEVDDFLGDLSPVMAAEDERLSRAFESARQVFLGKALPEARAAGAARVAQLVGARLRIREAAWKVAQEESNRIVEGWRPTFQPVAEQGYRELTERFVRLANERVRDLARSSGVPVELLPPGLPPESGFRVRSRLFYSEALAITTRSPLQALVDLIIPWAWFRKSVQRGAQAYVESLLDINTSRLVNDAIERVHESRRLLSGDLRRSVQTTASIAQEALVEARGKLARGSDAVAAELSRIDALRQRTLPAASPGGA